MSFVLLRKALEFAWYLTDEEKEFKTYDLMGLTNYYISEMDKARYYHKRYRPTPNLRYINGLTEPDRSIIRTMSKQEIDKILSNTNPIKKMEHANIKCYTFPKMEVEFKKILRSYAISEKYRDRMKTFIKRRKTENWGFSRKDMWWKKRINFEVMQKR